MAEIKLNNLTKHWGDIVGVDNQNLYACQSFRSAQSYV